MTLIPRLMWRPRTLYDAFVASGIVLMTTTGARALRQSLFALSAGGALTEFIAGSLVFVIACALGGVCSHRVFEFALSPIAAHVPGLARRAREELLALLALSTVAAGAVTLAVFRDTSDCFAYAALSAGAFGLGVFVSDPASRLLRDHGFLSLCGFLGLTMAVPELMICARTSPLLGLFVGCALGVLLVSIPWNRSRTRERAATRSSEMDRAYLDVDLRTGTWGRTSSSKGTRGDRFRGVRRTDFDWVRAAWHEWTADTRLGWLATILAQAGISVICVLAFHALATRGDAKTGGILVSFARDTNRSGVLVGPAFFVALWWTMIALGRPVLAIHGAHRPLARARRARVAWMASSIEDSIHAGTLLVLLAVVGILLARTVTPPYAASTNTWIGIAIAVFLVAPLARWSRLVFLDFAHGNPSSVRQAVVSATTILTTCFATSSLTIAWRELGGLSNSWCVLSAIALAIGTRAFWLAALERHHARADLAV